MLNKLAKIVRDTGSEIARWHADGINTSKKWEKDQLKTAADREAHRMLLGALNAIGEGFPVVSEEDESSLNPDRPEEYWLIDPIDGTRSLFGGFPGYVTQVALIRQERPVMAAIYAPAMDILYIAEEGKGAFKNGIKLCELSNNAGYEKLIDNYPEPRGIARSLHESFGFKKYIESGSIALKMCRIADGTADVFFKDVVVRDWDIAPAHLLLREVNGYVTDMFGGDIIYAGEYVKNGLIAASCRDKCLEIAGWHKKFLKKEGAKI